MLKSIAFAIALLASGGVAFAQYVPNDPAPTHPQLSPADPQRPSANPRVLPEEPGTTGQAIQPDGRRQIPQNDPNSPECIPQYDSSGAQVKPCPNSPR
jgi:hypothetical protein